MGILKLLIDFYLLIVLAAVIMSWVQPPRDNPVVQFINGAVDPVLKPIQQLLPDTGGIDFSPMVLFFGLTIIRGFL